MAPGYSFYESSLTHLVESLIQLPELPWSQLQRVLALCPRVDVSPWLAVQSSRTFNGI